MPDMRGGMKEKLGSTLTALILLVGTILMLGFSSTKPTNSAAMDAVWVYQKDGTQSCGMGAGKSLEQAQIDLQSAHIQILDAKKGDDGKPMIQMCGATTGSFNSYKIPKKDLEAAAKLGFKKLD